MDAASSADLDAEPEAERWVIEGATEWQARVASAEEVASHGPLYALVTRSAPLVTPVRATIELSDGDGSEAESEAESEAASEAGLWY